MPEPPGTFGDYLRHERQQSGHTLRSFSKASSFAVSTLSRWENSQRVPLRPDVERLSKALGVGRRLVDAWEDFTSPGLPPWMRSPGAREERAVAIDTISVSLVPGLIQSPGYAREVFRAFNPLAPHDEIEHLTQLRVARYEALIRRNDPLVSALFPIHSLRHLPRAIKEDQVHHLLRHLRRGRLWVYLVPEHVPILAVSSSAQVYRMADGKAVAASDHVRGNVLLEKPGDTESVESLIRDLIGLASPRSESATLLEALLHA